MFVCDSVFPAGTETPEPNVADDKRDFVVAERGDLPTSFVQTVPEEEATGLLKELYDKNAAAQGYISNYIKALSLHPEIVNGYRNLIKILRERVDLRRYELITIAVSATLRCSY